MKTGIELITIERQRQIDVEGWSKSHDSEHINGDIALAAACYCAHKRMDKAEEMIDLDSTKILDHPELWPWSSRWWKPSPHDRVKELVKAGALIAAEIDRINDLKK